MSDEAERIRREMQNVRQEMGHDVHAVVERAKELSDWRYYVRRHPWICASSALALGFLAMPGRGTRTLAPDVQRLISQLNKHGLTVAATKAAPSGLLGQALAVAGPIVLRNAASLLTRRLSGAEVHQAPDASSAREAP
jgi:hypothetical protein